MKNKFTNIALKTILIIAVIIGMFAAFKRINIESKNSSVEFVMDWQDLGKLSIREGIPLDLLLTKLKGAGLTSIAFTDETLESLELEGKLAWITGYEKDTLLKLSKALKTDGKISQKVKRLDNPILRSALRQFKSEPHFSYVLSDDSRLLSRLKEELTIILGEKRVRYCAPQTLEIIDDEEDLMTLGIGISPEKFQFAQKHGFYPVLRLKNNYRLDGAKAEQKISRLLANGGFQTIIFDGDEVLGYKNNVKDIAQAFKKFGINYGYIEMAEQKGDSLLLKNVKYNIIRVHSISEDEMQKKMTKEEAVDRFERAVSERGVRLLYIRPFYSPDKGKDLIDTNTSYLTEIKKKITESFHSAGQASRPQIIHVKIISLLILSLGAAIGLIFLINCFITLQPAAIYLVLLSNCVILLLFKAGGQILLFQKLTALLSAIVFPSLAITSVFKRQEDRLFMTVSRVTIVVLRIFIITMIGSILIIGLLSDTLFMLGSQQFIGIKIAFILPLLIVALYCALIEKESFKKLYNELINWINKPITTAAVLSAAVFGLIFVLYILRSGNFGIGILKSEKAFRSLLENIMVVRPRTKEFLIGYPFLTLAAIYYLKGAKKWLWLFLIVGLVGPISTLNTFCHVHSPLAISILRVFYGLIFGIVFGLIFYGIYSLALRFSKK